MLFNFIISIKNEHVSTLSQWSTEKKNVTTEEIKKTEKSSLFWVVVCKVEKGTPEFQLSMDGMSIHIWPT
jgi:hypothetical protein